MYNKWVESGGAMSSVNNLSQQFRRQHQAAKHKTVHKYAQDSDTYIDEIFRSIILQVCDLKSWILKTNLGIFIFKKQEYVTGKQKKPNVV